MAAIVTFLCCLGGQAGQRIAPAVSSFDARTADGQADVVGPNLQEVGGDRRRSVLGKILFDTRASVEGLEATAASSEAVGGGLAASCREPSSLGRTAWLTAENIKIAAVTSVVMTDTVSDVVLGLVLSSSGDPQGYATLGIVVVSVTAQALTTRFYREDLCNQFYALVGFKPVVDAYRIIFNVPDPDGSVLSNKQMMIYTRLIEATTESFFQVRPVRSFRRAQSPGCVLEEPHHNQLIMVDNTVDNC